jgi:thioredoxin
MMAMQEVRAGRAEAAAGSLHDRLQHAQQPVVIDVWAPWCGPCRAMEPHLAAVRSEFAGQVDVWKINADEQPEAVRALGVMGIPTLIVYREGREVARHTGGMHAAGIRSLFAQARATDAPAAPGSAGEVADYDRRLRLGAAAVLLVLAAFTGWPVVLLLAAAAVFFSAIHDRCPLWQGIKGRLGW